MQAISKQMNIQVPESKSGDLNKSLEKTVEVEDLHVATSDLLSNQQR